MMNPKPARSQANAAMYVSVPSTPPIICRPTNHITAGGAIAAKTSILLIPRTTWSLVPVWITL
jgi:hypothetical protein